MYIPLSFLFCFALAGEKGDGAGTPRRDPSREQVRPDGPVLRARRQSRRGHVLRRRRRADLQGITYFHDGQPLQN